MECTSVSNYFIIQPNLSDRTTLRLVEAAQNSGKRVLLNLVPNHKVRRKLLQYVSVAILNQTQLGEITGMVIKDLEDTKTAVLRIYGRGVDTTIVKMKNGSVLVFTEEVFTLINNIHVPCDFEISLYQTSLQKLV